jgi:ABC-type Fe3+ transport system substrate-binding protein
MFVSTHTGQTIIKYYDNERDAIKYINYVISKDAQETIEA